MIRTAYFVTAGCSLLTVALFGYHAAAQDLARQDPEAAIEVQTRGPIHEAFAQPNDLKPEPGLPVPKQPPAPVPEEAPEQRPEGDSVQWIAGYWAWDADRNEFLWVSGTYRNAPPGRQFVPGHWVHTADGWVWVPGFWAPLTRDELPYGPEPPAPLETEPLLPPPNENSFYVPGYWAYREARFAWRPGYYAPYRAGRMWVSPRYLWTPAGYLFVDGYWDFPLEDRGLLFAPVCFTRPLWLTAGWCYRPSFVVRPDCLLDALFIRGRSSQFYFGNYYGNSYARAGFNPWFAGSGRRDPLFNYYRWNNRADTNWATGLERNHAERVAGRVAAPPMTFAQQSKIVNKNNFRAVTPLNQFQSDKVHLVKAGAVQMENARLGGQRTLDLAQARAKLEAAGTEKNVARIEKRPLKLTPPSQSAVVNPAKTASNPATPSINKPNVENPRIGAVPFKSDSPKGTSPQPTPRVIDAPKAPAPKVVAPQPTPRVIDAPKTPAPRVVAPQPTPRVIDAPKAPAPRVVAPQPKPRAIEAPRVTPPRATPLPPTPKPSPPPTSKPRASTAPAPAARPPAPAARAPAPAARAQAPRTSPPRVSAPSGGRSAPPASSGGRSSGKSGGGNKKGR